MTTGSIPVLSKSYVFDPRPRLPFRIAVKRYWIGECPDVIDREKFSKHREDVLTLVFMHGIGAHKEHWEPTIQRLFLNQQAAARRSVRFHDMWSLDMPNQGDSAILNEEPLRWGCDTFSWENCTRGAHAFLAGLGTGVDVDFSKRKLAFVGHSLGANVAVSATTYYPLLKVWSLHLFEPFLLGEKGEDWGSQLTKMADKRRDIWPSSEEAFQALKSRPTCRTWDERILKILVEHGLRPLPTAEYPDLKEGVTLKCTRKQEAATFRDRVSHGIAYRCLPHVLKEIPTHITYGAVMNFMRVVVPSTSRYGRIY